jgi:aspartyl-tRNA(Asn)/glutamyl-tRNA(Gln) amidotransferase subunit B
VAYEIRRHTATLEAGERVSQETVGWDESAQATFSQRFKEEAHDYRYFPEPDLPPLMVPEAWVQSVRGSLPELPDTKRRRFVSQYGLGEAEATLLVEEEAIAEYFEGAAESNSVAARSVAGWITGELFALLNESGLGIEEVSISPGNFADLLGMVAGGGINPNTGKAVLAEMFAGGRTAREIVADHGLAQLSGGALIADRGWCWRSRGAGKLPPGKATGKPALGLKRQEGQPANCARRIEWR